MDKSLSVSGGGMMKRKTACPFGAGFYGKISRLLLSDEPSAEEELKELAQMVQNAKMSNTDEFWDSGDELTADSSQKPVLGLAGLKKAPHDRMKIMKLESVPIPEKKKTVAPPKAPKAVPAPVVDPASSTRMSTPPAPKKRDDFIETLDDDSDSEKDCFKCFQSTSTSDNPMAVCESCQTGYHLKCHIPEIDPQLAAGGFLCASCNQHNKPKSRSASPKPVSSSSRSLDEKPKPSAKSTTDLSATFEAYKKKKERQIMRAGGLVKK